MKPLSISEINDPLAKKLAEEYLPMVERKEPKPLNKYEGYLVCPFADQGHRLEENVNFLPGTEPKEAIFCLRLVEKYKPKKVGGKWIVPAQKLKKCHHVDKVGEKYGWEDPEIFQKCKVLHPDHSPVLAVSITGKVLHPSRPILNPYGVSKELIFASYGPKALLRSEDEERKQGIGQTKEINE